MSLSHDEQVRLDQIEAHIRSTDPLLSRRLAVVSLERHRRRRLTEGIVLSLIGTVVMILGAALVSSTGWTGTMIFLAGCGVLVWALLHTRELSPPWDGGRDDAGLGLTR